MNQDASPACRRCGTCCERGGPALHRQDTPLVESGQLPASSLFTIRKGELARDNVQGTLVPQVQEIIKIKGQKGGWTCLFYQAQHHGCGMYDHRPLECQVLNCRDTAAIEQIYDQDRLTRKDLLGQMDGLWELVADHEQRCSYARMGDLAAQGLAPDQTPVEMAAMLEIMRFDGHIRQLAVERGGLEAGMLDFVFGRPLDRTIAMFRLKLELQNGDYRLVGDKSNV